MTNEYELAGPTRAGLIYEKQDLLAPLLQRDAGRRRTRWSPGTTDTRLLPGRGHPGACPSSRRWVDEHRPDDPTLPGGAGLDAASDAGETAARDGRDASPAATQQGAR